MDQYIIHENIIRYEDDYKTIAKKIYFGFTIHQSCSMNIDKGENVIHWLKIYDANFRTNIKGAGIIGIITGKAFKIKRTKNKISIWRLQ